MLRESGELQKPLLHHPGGEAITLSARNVSARPSVNALTGAVKALNFPEEVKPAVGPTDLPVPPVPTSPYPICDMDDQQACE